MVPSAPPTLAVLVLPCLSRGAASFIPDGRTLRRRITNSNQRRVQGGGASLVIFLHISEHFKDISSTWARVRRLLMSKCLCLMFLDGQRRPGTSEAEQTLSPQDVCPPPWRSLLLLLHTYMLVQLTGRGCCLSTVQEAMLGFPQDW